MLSSSAKYECLLSPPVMSRLAGVMCSATQCGFLVVRLKDEVSEHAFRISETGPGKPYWKTPAGSTGGWRGTALRGSGTGAGGGGVVRVALGFETVVVVVAMVVAGDSFLLPIPYRATVVAAPTAAEAPATTAMVNLDMAGDGDGIHRRHEAARWESTALWVSSSSAAAGSHRHVQRSFTSTFFRREAGA